MQKRESAYSTWTDGNFLRVSGAGCQSASVVSHLSVCSACRHASSGGANIFALRSAGVVASSATVFPSHIAPAPASSHQPGNSVFLSYHSSSSLQLQPAECSVGWKTESPRPGSCSPFYQPNNHGS